MLRFTWSCFGRGNVLCATSALALGILWTSASSAQIPTAGPLTVVANGDLFANCTADKVGSQPGTVFPRTSIEPNLAINPANPKNFLAGIQHDRWSNGGSRGLRGAYSADGGFNWLPTITPNVTQCQNGPWPRSSDPWVTFSPDGTAYFSELVTEELPNPDLFGHNGQTISQSTDGGLHWYPPTTLIDTPAQPDPSKPQILNDKNATTADPRDSRYVYVVWDQLTSFTPGYGRSDEVGGDDGPDAMAAARGAPDVMTLTRSLKSQARARAANGTAITADSASAYPTYDTGPTWFSRTTNHGQSWEAAHIIYDPGSNNQTIGNQIVLLPDNRLADFFVHINNLTGASSIGFVASSDFGKTWSKPYFPEVQVNTQAVTPNLGEPIRSADILFSVSVDRKNGLVALAWEDTRYSGVNEVAVAFSGDNGYSWFGPTHVNQTPRNPSHPLFQQAIIPTIVSTDDGTLVVTYYDFRRDTVGATTDNADYWAITCNPFTSSDACQSTYDWHREVKLNFAAFNFNDAPNAGGHFLGDYMGLKSVGQTAYPVFGMTTGKNTTADYMRPIYVPVSQGAHANLVAANQ